MITKSVNQKEKYNKVGNFFDYVSGIFERNTINNAIDMLNLKKEDYFLDLACGTGKVLKYASKKTKKLYGCDFSDKMLTVCKKRNKNINVELKLCDITTKLPYKNNTFDKINFSVTLGMINTEYYKKVFSEIKRVLKKDGKIVITEYTTKKRNIFTKILELEHKLIPKFQDCKPINVEEILIKNNFKILILKTTSVFGFKFEIVLASVR
ncbi:MAG: methyltransferase domain-containing protein [Candidatus Woesearchaeota archaeon]|jgi:ubiquinone/menaquinone biosynthesis C-methylase UbiE